MFSIFFQSKILLFLSSMMVQKINNNTVKFIASLKDKKNRQKHGCFVAEGVKIADEFLSSSIVVKTIVALPGWVEGRALPTGVVVYEATPQLLKKISSLTQPNEVLLVCEIPEMKVNAERLKENLSVMLDGIRDPGNMGTIIRIADWFGIGHVICSDDCVDVYNSKVVQSAMGSLARVNVAYTDLLQLTRTLKQYKLPIYAAHLNGDDVRHVKPGKNGILMIGSESHGISEKLCALADNKIKIPLFGKAESLNAAIAAAILCYEFRR